MSNTGPKKLPTLRDPKNPEEVAIWMREVRKIIGDLDTTLDSLQTQITTIQNTPAGVTSVTGTAPITVTPTTGAAVVSINTSGFATLPIAESDVTNLVTDLAGKAAVSHTHAESDVTGLVTDLAGKAPTTRSIATTAPLTGGGDLSADRTLAVSTFGTANSGVVPSSGGGTTNYLRADGTWASPPGAVTLPIAESDVTNLNTDLAAKALKTTTISTTSPLAGGGDLSANRTLSINTNGIDNTLIRQGAALTVIGRSANSTGNVADIAAANDGDVLRRSGTTLGFGAIPESSVTSLVSDLAGKVPTTRTLTGTAPVRIDGGASADLSANRTISINAWDAFGLYAITSDGSVTFDGSSVVLGLTPSSSVYTLTRSIFCTSLTVNNGVTIKVAGFRIFCTTLTNNGTIHANGTDGVGSTSAGTGAAAAFLGGGTNGGPRGGTGGAGAATTATPIPLGVTDTSSLAGTAINGSTSANPFRGGGGGGATTTSVASTTAGGNGGTTTVLADANTQGSADIFALMNGRPGGSSPTTWTFGTGGGGGGQISFAPSTCTGGEGGGGAGYVLVVAKTLGGSGTISANGGNASAATATNGGSGSSAAAGGGGGGGGGLVVCIYQTRAGSLTIQANGGNGSLGAGAGAGSPVGNSGANGSAGVVLLVNTSGDGT